MLVCVCVHFDLQAHSSVPDLTTLVLHVWMISQFQTYLFRSFEMLFVSFRKKMHLNTKAFVF